MRYKKVVGFGDSWIWGDELLDPALENHPQSHPVLVENTYYRESNCFLGKIAQHYETGWENFGIPGGSLQSTVWTFLWWLDHEPNPEQCLVLVGLTEADRFSLYNPNHVHYSNDPPWNKFVHSAWVEYGSDVIGPNFTNVIKHQLVLTNCEELRKLNYYQTALFFDGVASRKNIDLFQFNIMPAPNRVDLPTLAWPEFSLSEWFAELRMQGKNQYRKSGGHPSELGHELIRNRLISHIESCTIKGC